DDAGLPKLGQMITEVRLRAEVEKLAAVERHPFIAGDVADDRQAGWISERGEHRREIDLFDCGLRKQHGVKLTKMSAVAMRGGRSPIPSGLSGLFLSVGHCLSRKPAPLFGITVHLLTRG